MAGYALSEVEEAPSYSADEVEEAPTKQQSAAAMDQVTRPQSPAPGAPSSAKAFDLQNTLPAPKGLLKPGNINLNNRLQSPRSTAEGLLTEHKERRGGMPLAIQPANYGLENPHPEQVVATPRPNATLSRGAQPNVDVQEPDAVPLPASR